MCKKSLAVRRSAVNARMDFEERLRHGEFKETEYLCKSYTLISGLFFSMKRLHWNISEVDFRLSNNNTRAMTIFYTGRYTLTL